MADKEEWGPWIEHDGKGCPCEGEYIQGEHRDGVRFEGVAGRLARAEGFDPNISSCWIWGWPTPKAFEIVRYRIRKPRGLTILETIAREVEREGVDA